MKEWKTRNGYRILKVLAGRSNVFLVEAGTKNFLIDTSAGFMWKALNMQLRKLNIKKIDFLILTHSHFDHAANAYRIRKLFGPEIFIHRLESECLAYGRNPPTDGTNFFYKLILKVQSSPVKCFMNYAPCLYDHVVDSETDFNDLGINAFILHTPGHTRGSMSFIVDNEYAFVGDCMFGIFKGSIFPPVAADIAEMTRSWDKLLKTGCNLFLPSHGSEIPRSLVEEEYRKYYIKAS